MRIPTPTRTTPEQYPDSDSGESDYHSAEEASPEFDKAAEDGEMGCDWEISRSSISVSYTPKDETYSSNPLLCMNAATFMACINSARALKQLLSRETLQRIITIDTPYKSTETLEIPDLPMFSSKFSYETTTILNTMDILHDYIQLLHDLDGVAVMTAGIRCITVSTVLKSSNKAGTSVIIFAPPLGSSKSDEVHEVVLHSFPTIHEASSYIAEIFQPSQELMAYVMIPKAPFNGEHERILPVYESNIRLLEMTMKLNDLKSDVQSYLRNIGNMKLSLEAEESKTQDFNASVVAIQREIDEMEEELTKEQERTNKLLSQSSEGVWQEWENAESIGITGAKESKQAWGISWETPKRYLANISTVISPSHSPPHTIRERRMSPKPTSRKYSNSNPYSSLFASSSKNYEQGDIDQSFAEALRLQAQFTEEGDASWELARRLDAEERAQVAEFEVLQRAEKENAPFDCPICTDTLPRGNLVKIESCAQACAVCRECLLQHIKAQVEQARWPIFCPICPRDSPRRGVVSRWMAEIVGADDAVFAQWNRMELAKFSISVECPKCKVSTPLDAEDFKAASVLDCPVGCGAHWCKNCHRQIARKGVHSCDGEAEFREMVRTQNTLFRPCPRCGSMIEKNGGCDNMVCTAPGCGTRFTWTSAAHQR